MRMKTMRKKKKKEGNLYGADEADCGDERGKVI